LTSFSLTEYSAKPTPPTEDRKAHMKNIVPDEFLLPNGNPDVSLLSQHWSWREHVLPGGHSPAGMPELAAGAPPTLFLFDM
jgi:hypothetical protein